MNLKLADADQYLMRMETHYNLLKCHRFKTRHENEGGEIRKVKKFQYKLPIMTMSFLVVEYKPNFKYWYRK